ncbi:MAG: response regulator [Oscillospiraceae bacterium]|nr:response regulator [Oscillospiraceae bacterium]
MKNRITRFIFVSLIFLSVLCILVFSLMARYMHDKSGETIDEIGSVYMKGVGEQILLNFETSMDLRMSQMEAWYKNETLDPQNDRESMRSTFAYLAKARGYSNIGYYYGGNDFDMLYGDKIQIKDHDQFQGMLEDGNRWISIATDANGENLAILGVPIDYTDGNNQKVLALTVTLSMDYISRIFAMEKEDTLVNSYIILPNGSFVVRHNQGNYFDSVRERGDNKLLQYIDDLEAAMEVGVDYTGVFGENDERIRVYCAALAYSDWYLVTAMPFGMLNETIDGLNRSRMFSALGACGIILLAFVFIFFGYFRLTRQQIRELDKARDDAVRATKAKTEFLSNMSHDIRTPMNAIVGMTAIATANIDNKEQVKNCLRKITLSSRHLLGLINDVLDMSKIESGKMTLNMDKISLSEVMDGIVNIAQPQVKAKEQHFDVFIHDVSHENVMSDSVRLNQVLLNLISNAIKFTPEKGKIQITMYQEKSPKGDNFIRTHFMIKDTGIGMSPEFLKNVFESYAREDSARVRKTEGAGLGMAITKYIVDAMEGDITVESEQGQGTEFRVMIDFEKASQYEEELILPAWNMLVVDDDKMLCESAVSSLRETGVNAEWTLDGESAVELIDKRHSENNDYHIILLDWKLPGMDGIETARAIHDHLGVDIPILLISAYDWGDIEEEAKDAGISGFIPKPLFKSTLYNGLKRFAAVSEIKEAEIYENEISFEGKKILIAEDNELNWEIAEALLSGLGIELEWAQNGQICLEKLNESPEGYYDAILMDIRMPVMTGYEAASAIRKENRKDSDIPIIAMTADAFAEDIKKCLDCGMNAHIAKPIDIQEVSRVLNKYIMKN